MRLRSCLAVPALVAVLVLSGCKSGNSGGSATYNSGGGNSGGSRSVAYAPPSAPAARSVTRSGNTAYIIMTQNCGYCQKLRSNTLPDGNVRSELAALNAQEVYADSGSGRAIADRYHITGFPTTVVVDSSGAVVKKIVGYSPPGDYAAQLRQAH